MTRPPQPPGTATPDPVAPPDTSPLAERELQLMALDVNGVRHEVITEPRRTLVDVLRHDLRLTGTHVGCEHGICGACTVLLDDRPVRACLIFAAQAEGARIRTVESVGTGSSPGSSGDAGVAGSAGACAEVDVPGGASTGGAHDSSPDACGRRDQLSDLQRAFRDRHALQCGFCTPGFLMLAEGFLAERPDPSREEIREVVAANLCRCTGYQPIVEAIEDCAAARRAARATTRPEPRKEK
ncbi:(2Fe-2S)-binding protein [Streptomyces sp. NPDC090442]|uniref:(2Fe-2S)-binding protein n=1 Tax=Streptomyces sp. NPDC090442 TaxID=3365962 RepID=UPI003818FB84